MSEDKKRKKYFTEIFITQSICIIVILIVILTTKFFFKSTFNEIKDIYKKYICTQTKIEEVTSFNEELELN